MIKNYFRTAWRNLKGNKFYSLVNISGLAVGLATGIMLLLWIQSERSYDEFHRDYSQIYKLSTHFEANGETTTWEGVPAPLSVVSKSIPQVESIVRTKSEWDQVLSTPNREKIFDGNKTAYVDSTFFSIFDFELERGTITSLFPNNNSVVLTQSTAEKLFDNDAVAMGQEIVFQGNNFTVTGVLADFPENSSVQYDAIFPMGFTGNFLLKEAEMEPGKKSMKIWATLIMMFSSSFNPMRDLKKLDKSLLPFLKRRKKSAVLNFVCNAWTVFI